MDTIYKCSVDEVTMGALIFVFKPVQAMNWQLTILKVR